MTVVRFQDDGRGPSGWRWPGPQDDGAGALGMAVAGRPQDDGGRALRVTVVGRRDEMGKGTMAPGRGSPFPVCKFPADVTALPDTRPYRDRLTPAAGFLVTNI